jgi:EmrB/QacA subfamily drug resistance transporter
MSSPNYLTPASRAEALPHRWWTLATLFLAVTMNLLDVTIVNVGLPAMQAGLGASSTQIEWVSAIYVLAFALGLLPFGRLGDIVGRKLMFVAGAAAFTVTSLLCGVAPSIETLIAARLLQGIAGAAMVPQVLALIAVIFPPEEKPTAFSLFGVIGSLASVAGPLIGGALISADLFSLDWRVVFLINLPLGALVLVGSRMFLPATPANPAIKLDWAGIAFFGLTTFLVVFPLIEGRTFGWPWWIMGMLFAAPLAAIGFYLWERRQALVGHTELVPAHLLGNRSFMTGLVTVTLFFSGIPGLFLVLAVMLQNGFGMSPLASGLATMPFPAGVMIASLLSGRLGANFLRQRVGLGSLILAAGMTYLHFALLSLDSPMNSFSLLPPLLLCGLGMGVAISALFQSLMTGVPAQDSGAASGALQAFQNVGGALGIAIAGQIFFSTLGGSTDPHAYGAAASQATWYQITTFSLIAIFNFVVSLRSRPTQPA